MQTIADIDNPGIVQPFNTPAVIPESCPGSHFGNLKLFVLFCQLGRNLIEYVQNAGLIHTGGIISDIFLIIGNELSLYIQGTFEGIFGDEFPHYGRHTAQNTVIQKKRMTDRQLKFAERN